MTRVITPSDEEWPARLSELGPYRPPSRLFVEGSRMPKRTAPVVAIVGTRRPTAAGLDIASRLARDLSRAGVVVVSGLAIGIDAAAHRGALEAGGHTIAVLGCGTDVLYPRANTGLRHEIIRRGGLVSEYPDGVGPARHHFPLRNRLIAGLADGVVVVEGRVTSGALVTARLALDCSRNVYAVPGSLHNPAAEGPNDLIRTSQAALVTSAEDILCDLTPGRLLPPAAPPTPREAPADPDEEVMWRALDDEPSPLEQLCAGAALDPSRAAAALSRLELRGLARRSLAGYSRGAGGGS